MNNHARVESGDAACVCVCVWKKNYNGDNDNKNGSRAKRATNLATIFMHMFINRCVQVNIRMVWISHPHPPSSSHMQNHMLFVL